MKSYLVASIVLVAVALCFILENHPAHAVPYAYNNTAFTIPWNVTAKTSNDYFFEPGYNGTITSWYRLSSSTMQKQLGSGVSSFTLNHAPANNAMPNGTNFYVEFAATTTVEQLDHYNILTGSVTHDFSSSCPSTGSAMYVFIFQNFPALYCYSSSGATKATSGGGNVTNGPTMTGGSTISNMKIIFPNTSITEWYNDFSYNFPAYTIPSAHQCEFVYTPTNATIAIDNIACDKSIPNHATHYWHGFALNGVNAYATNSTYPFIQSVLSNQYKTMLTMDGAELGIPTDQFTDFIMHTPNGDYMFVVTSSNIYDAPVSTINSILNANRATQTYFITDNLAPTNFPMINNTGYSITFYGPAINTMQTTKGVVSLVSPFTMTTTGNGLQPNTNGGSSYVIRTIDPQWTNDNNVYPVVETGTGQSMFQTFLTVSNAPTDGAIKATNPYWTYSYTYEPNLVSNLKLQSNIIDYNNYVTIHTKGTTSFATTANNLGYNFTGTNSLFTNTNMFNGLTQWTMSGWIYLRNETSSSQSHIFDSSSCSQYGGGILWAPSDSASYLWTFKCGDDHGVFTLPIKSWHFFTITWNDNILTGYLDGVQTSIYTLGSRPPAFNSVSSYNYFGSDSSLNNNLFYGQMFNFKVYDTALSSAQVAQLYSTGTYTTTTNNYGEDIWAVTRMDSTRSAEYDILPNQCQNIYMADISVKPTVFIYQGSTCSTGANAKTIAYTASLPVNFYSFKYGASDSYVPSTNTLTTMTRSTVTPFTYTVIVKNSTGAVAVNQTYTTSSTLDTRTFNVTGVTKPASLSISVAGSQIYSSYLGSPVSLSSVASFFHQYFSYDGFDFLSFLPIMFAGMFTRNTVGIGVVLTVVMIATLSWLSVVVVPDTVVFISIIVAVIGLVGYRGIYG